MFNLQVLDPRLKLHYMEKNKWEKKWIVKAKNEVCKVAILNRKINLFKLYLIGIGNLSRKICTERK